MPSWLSASRAFTGIAAQPTFSPAGGTYTSSQSVTISTVTPGASIYYTQDGSTPTVASTRYTGPVTISGTETLKAIAILAGNQPGTVGSASYVITGALSFDFYIATNGSDANLGTLSQPWAMTSLSRHANPTNNAKMAGKRVGMLPGTYAIYSMYSSGLYSYQDPVFNVPSGTSGAQTFLGASDSSGYQTTGGVYITASPSGSPGGGLPSGTGGAAMAGQWNGDGGGYAQIDGLVLSDCLSVGVSFYGPTSTQGGPRGFACTNCEVYNVGGVEGGNPACVSFYYATGALCQNCKLHDNILVSGSAGHNFAGILSQNCLDNIYEYNTIYNCNSAIYDKNNNQGGQTIRYNYLEVNGANPFDCLMDCAGGLAGQTTLVHNNILVIAASTTAERAFWQGVCTTGPTYHPLQTSVFYNNTCYVLGGGGVQLGWTCQAEGSGTVTHYNNIYVASAASANWGILNFYATGTPVAISDYNAYIGGCQAYLGTGTGGNVSTLRDLATWQSALSLDLHSIQQASETSPAVFTSPGGAQSPIGYKLASGSPCAGTGSTTGTSGGAACDMGAYGGASPPIRIGSTL